MGNSCMIPTTSTTIITTTTTTNSSKNSLVVAIFTRPKNIKLFQKRQHQSKIRVALSSIGKKNSNATIVTTPEKKGNVNNLLTSRDRELIIFCWRNNIEHDRKDLFHKTMLRCIEASPKMNEIIACGRYCYRDLTKWPKLNRICQAQFNFFNKLINEYEMDEDKMFAACAQLGEMHANYAQFGLKPHFLDIFQQQLLGLIARLEIDNKVETCIAFTHLITFVVDVMIEAYSNKAANIRMLTNC